MKEFSLYAGAIAGNVLLIYGSEKWYGAMWFTEWLFGLLAIGLFALFLQGWKRTGRSGIGLVFLTAFILLAINSIFFVQDLPAGICSFLMVLLLIPHYADHRDAVMTAGGFVLLNILISLEVQNEMTMWLLFLTTGIGALIGFRLKLPLLKGCFTSLFSLVAFVLLFMNFFTGAYLISLLLIVAITFFVMGIYRLSESTQS